MTNCEQNLEAIKTNTAIIVTILGEIKTVLNEMKTKEENTNELLTTLVISIEGAL